MTAATARRRPAPYTILEGCTVKAVTSNAVLLDFGRGPEWVPVSQVHHESLPLGKGDNTDVKVTTWICQQKGWN